MISEKEREKNMGKWKQILWGICFVALGLIIGLNTLGLANIEIFFDGWWTLLIIIPSAIGLFGRDNKLSNIIGLLLGVALLLAAQGIITFRIIAQLALPSLLVIIGLVILFNEVLRRKVKEKIASSNQELESIIATFAEQKVNKDGEEFTGANIEAVFGGTTLDLRDANIKKESFIKASAIFGGVTIYVPDNINVKVTSTPIFGGVTNKTSRKEKQDTLYIDAFCLFGGIEIK